MFTLPLEDFRALAQKGNLVSLHRELLADLTTPVATLMRMAADTGRVFLLESVEGGENLARYSFLGRDPELILRLRGGKTLIEENGETKVVEAPFLEELKRLLRRYRPARSPGLPRFAGGAVGYFAYDIVRQLERVPETNPDDLGLDDAVVMFFKTVIAFDHVRHRMLLLTSVPVDDPADADAAYARGIEDLDRMTARLRAPFLDMSMPRQGKTIEFTSNLTRPQFEEMVEQSKEFIRAGDIFQVVLSQRFQTEVSSSGLDLYRALRSLNPSPYMFYLSIDADTQLIGASPEALVRVSDGIVETHPIAGTRHRSADPKEDERLAEELRADAKELAEHVMLVDLGRNDIGRVCEYGSVELSQRMVIERYSHVMHLVSHVQGKLRPDLDPVDALAACFPAGTVSGAPKVRAMEIIEDLEPQRRGPYAGAVGHLDYGGNLDTCITIRTLLRRGSRVYLQAGAGIVADSRPDREFDETVNKGKALMRAVEIAELGFLG
ncbi:MAG: anthranilate synthase component I [Planctomycetota bacterium]